MAVNKTELQNLETKFQSIYRNESSSFHLRRWKKLIEIHSRRYHDYSPRLFSAPGRTELSGNHTDHNMGFVLSAAIQLDTIAAVTQVEEENIVEIISEGYPPVKVSLSQLDKVKAEEESSEALIRGIAASIASRGGRIGGFKASTSSRVLKGSGLSSSAALEILTGSIFNELYNDGRFLPLELAQIGAESERNYFGKPCGLMDQISCSVGGAIIIDFTKPIELGVRQINFNLSDSGFTLAIVNSGCSHADLTSDYSAIPEEMHAVASVLGAKHLGEVSEKSFMSKIGKLREKCGDRAVLRALHFFKENRRVQTMASCLEEGNMKAYLKGMRQSGNSSFRFLQNVLLPGQYVKQPMAIAMALSEEFLGESGAARVHGGGFAGAIQVLMPEEKYQEYKEFIEAYFGDDALIPLSIRQEKAGELK